MAQRSTSKRTSTPRRSTRKAKATFSPIAIIFLVGLLALLYLYETGRLDRWLGSAAPAAQAPAPAAANGDIRVFFTTPNLVYPDKRTQRGNSPLLAAVLADLDSANSSIEIASFDFDIPQITDALISAKQRGVAVRLIVDSENLTTPEVAQETGRLTAVAIPVHFDNREPFMHNKFIVIDSTTAWMGSWNLTENDTFRNNNNALRLHKRELALDYRNEFEQMFAGAFGVSKTSGTPYPQVTLGNAHIAVYFAPEDGVAQYVLNILDQAKTSIRFMAFSFTANDIAQAMINKHKAGLAVSGVFESQNANGSGAEFGPLRSSGVDVIEDGNCYILHHKTIIIDDHIVITGSYNFTSSAEQSNDENLVIIDDSTVASAYIEEYNRVRSQAQSPARCG